MPVKNKKPKKEGKKIHKEEISIQVVDEQNLKVKEIESEIQKNVEIITEEIEKPVKKEVHVFVKKELPMEDSKKEEKIEKNNGTMSQQEITQKLTEIYEDADGDTYPSSKVVKYYNTVASPAGYVRAVTAVSKTAD